MKCNAVYLPLAQFRAVAGDSPVLVPNPDCAERNRQKYQQICDETGPEQGIIPRETARIIVGNGESDVSMIVGVAHSAAPIEPNVESDESQ